MNAQQNTPAATIPTHDLGQRFNHAINTAIQNLSVKASIVAPEYMDGYKITRYVHPRGEVTFHVYDESAWERPAEAPLLPWTAPKGEVVATVSTEGIVALV